VPVATLAPDLPPALHAIIERCMAKVPGQRFPHGAALYQALRAIAPGAPSGEMLATMAPHARSVVGPETTLRHQRAARPLMGREPELARLVERLNETSRRRGGVVLLAGEPGVGKTYLSEELVREATDRGMLTLTGHCNEGSGTPYEPFV